MSPHTFDGMSVPQRLELIGEIWDSIPDDADAWEVPDWHREELDLRLAEADANPSAAIPWEEAKARLRKQP